jgi:hypothetical protein
MDAGIDSPAVRQDSPVGEHAREIELATEKLHGAEQGPEKPTAKRIRDPERPLLTEENNSDSPESTASEERPADQSTTESKTASDNTIKESRSKQSDSQSPVDAQAPTTDPFAEMPNTVQLPGIATDSQFLLGRIGEAGRNLLALTLSCSENVIGARATFDLVRDEVNKQKWHVTLSPRNAPVQQIGEFELRDRELKFRWLAEARDQKDAGYLLNCALRLEYPSHIKSISLRHPTPIEGLKFSRNQPEFRVDLPEIEFPPKVMIWELGQLDEAFYGKTFVPESQDGTALSKKHPLEIHFDGLPEFQLFSISLSADTRAKPRIHGAIRLHLDPMSNNTQLATPKAVEAAALVLAQTKDNLKSQYDAIDNMKTDEVRAHLKNPDLTYEDKKDLVANFKTAADRSEERFKIFATYEERLKPFYERQLPVVLYADVDGHRVILAATNQEFESGN